MVRARREYEGSLFAWHAAAVVAHLPFTARRLSPGEINPYRERDPEAERQLDEVRRHLAWQGLAAQAREAFERAGLLGGET